MPIRSLILACGALLVISLGMALRSLPGPPQAVVRPVAYVEHGTLATALAWRALVRAELRRVTSDQLSIAAFPTRRARTDIPARH